jgi:hypothetical protein
VTKGKDMTPIDYIVICAEILVLHISDKAKMLLGLIKRFGNKGLMMSNSDLAKLLCCSRDHVGKLLKEISLYITIENPQSRYRKIFYSGLYDGVDSDLLRRKQRSKNNSTPSSGTATQSFRTATPAKMTDIIKKNLNNTTYTEFSFVLRNKELWHLSQGKLDEYKRTFPNLDIEFELRKAAQWLNDNPHRRKTARGMPKFLGGWLGRTRQNPGQNHPDQICQDLTTHEATEEEADALFERIKI